MSAKYCTVTVLGDLIQRHPGIVGVAIIAADSRTYGVIAGSLYGGGGSSRKSGSYSGGGGTFGGGGSSGSF